MEVEEFLEFYLDMKRPLFLILFETSHCLTAEHLATMYGFEYTIASDESSLEKGLATYMVKMKARNTEILHQRFENDSILLQFLKSCRNM
jgi:2-succinyl-5-enolpyruvyl-6-hydroxy-3-cyclohexene-1-carboxylate synthase